MLAPSANVPIDRIRDESEETGGVGGVGKRGLVYDTLGERLSFR